MIVGHEQQRADLLRLAGRSALAHGYLFTGSRHVGKTTFVRAFARHLETGVFDTTSGQPLSDAHIVEGGSGVSSIGIDVVREIKHVLYQTPITSPRRIACIANAEQLTTEAQNALLKIAEEPPPHSLLILATHDPERILSTLRSRLQGIYFGAVPTPAIDELLREHHGVSAQDATKWARQAAGLPGLAVRLATDTSEQEYLDHARKYLRASGAQLNTFVKDLVATDDFSFDRFLGALAFAAAHAKLRDTRLLHAILDLRRGADSFNLNPRLQLTALKSGIER